MSEQELEFFLKSKNDDGRLLYTVTQISNEIKLILEDSYPGVWVQGEISNFKTYSSGHMYFNLKDQNAQINAVMFKGYNRGLNFVPEDGMTVLVYGRISSYPKRGDYQIIVSHMEEYGKGDLLKEYEKLKNKLEQEGLFDQKHKLPIPVPVNKIGVVTSKDGAALFDILKVLDELEADIEVLIYPVRVQGKEAEKEIPEALRYLNEKYKELDIILLGRGGGSMEDLSAFNTEEVARAIFNSKIPVISCIGHEVDFTISDFVADMRAPTPSAAAEMAVRGRTELKNKVLELKEKLEEEMDFIFNRLSERLTKLSSSRAFTKPHLIYEDKISYIDEINYKLENNIKKLLDLKSNNLRSASHKLDLISPLSVLKRGFSICFDHEGKVVKSSKSVKTDEIVDIKLAEGKLKARVEVRDE